MYNCEARRPSSGVAGLPPGGLLAVLVVVSMLVKNVTVPVVPRTANLSGSWMTLQLGLGGTWVGKVL